MRNRTREERETALWWSGRPGSPHSDIFLAVVGLYSQWKSESPTVTNQRKLNSLRCWKSAPEPLKDAADELELERVTLGLSGIGCEVSERTGRRKNFKRSWRRSRATL